MHLVFSSATHKAKLFNKDGTLNFECEMHDAAVHGPGFGHWGRCPRGTFRLGEPIDHEDPAFGFYFTPVLGVQNRGGIGIHGGGTGCAQPFAPEQGWIPTHGCLRVQNQDNRKLVLALRRVVEVNLVTVEGP